MCVRQFPNEKHVVKNFFCATFLCVCAWFFFFFEYYECSEAVGDTSSRKFAASFLGEVSWVTNQNRYTEENSEFMSFYLKLNYSSIRPLVPGTTSLLFTHSSTMLNDERRRIVCRSRSTEAPTTSQISAMYTKHRKSNTKHSVCLLLYS